MNGNNIRKNNYLYYNKGENKIQHVLCVEKLYQKVKIIGKYFFLKKK